MSSATITGKTGPAETITALVLANVTRVDFQLDRKVVTIYYGNNQVFETDYAVTVTVTDTISGTTSTFTLST